MNRASAYILHKDSSYPQGQGRNNQILVERPHDKEQIRRESMGTAEKIDGPFQLLIRQLDPSKQNHIEILEWR